MTTTKLMYTPWGWTKDAVELADGITKVTTASHGGLRLSPERWDELPAAVRGTMSCESFAEEDCEEPIVKTLLGVGGDRDREAALAVAGYFERYAPALPFVRSRLPGTHHHVLLHWGGHCSDAFGRFDTRAEAESFANDPALVRRHGRMEAIDCTGTRSLCLEEGEAR